MSLLERFCAADDVCRRIHQHRSSVAWLGGKTSVGWFFGFTLRLVFNDWVELLPLR